MIRSRQRRMTSALVECAVDAAAHRTAAEAPSISRVACVRLQTELLHVAATRATHWPRMPPALLAQTRATTVQRGSSYHKGPRIPLTPTAWTSAPPSTALDPGARGALAQRHVMEACERVPTAFQQRHRVEAQGAQQRQAKRSNLTATCKRVQLPIASDHGARGARALRPVAAKACRRCVVAVGALQLNCRATILTLCVHGCGLAEIIHRHLPGRRWWVAMQCA